MSKDQPLPSTLKAVVIALVVSLALMSPAIYYAVKQLQNDRVEAHRR